MNRDKPSKNKPFESGIKSYPLSAFSQADAGEVYFKSEVDEKLALLEKRLALYTEIAEEVVKEDAIEKKPGQIYADLRWLYYCPDEDL